MWTVYEHITPSGKRYIGITSQKPEKRWSNGRGYEKGSAFRRAIDKYGWDDIQHNILFNDLTEKEAKWLENYLICYYRTFIGFKYSMGYNMTLGGEGVVGHHHTPWNKGKKTGKPAWNKGKKCGPLSEQHKQKLSELKKGKPSNTTGKHWKLIDGKRHYE